MKRSRAAGFSLVELMVAMTLGMIILAGVIQLYASTKRSFQTQNAIAQLQEAGRFAIDTIADDLRLAGYWGGNLELTSIGGSAPPLPADGSCPGGSTDWARMLAQRIHGLNDSSSAYACISQSDYRGGDVLTVLFADPSPTSDPAQDSGRLFLRTSLTSGRLFPGAQADAGINQVSAAPSPSHALHARAYYIGHARGDGGRHRQCGGATIPALVRKHLDSNGTPRRQELVAGIEDLQIRYGLDTNGDGSTNQYLDAQQVTDWSRVMAAQIWVLARQACPDPTYTDAGRYRLGDQGPYEPQDHFHRQLFTTTVTLRNREVS